MAPCFRGITDGIYRVSVAIQNQGKGDACGTEKLVQQRSGVFSGCCRHPGILRKG